MPFAPHPVAASRSAVAPNTQPKDQPMSRPSKLTPEVASNIAERIRAGASLAEAAEAEDVADRTAREWLQAGVADSTGPYGDFARLVARATHARGGEEPGEAPRQVATLPALPGLELLDLEALRASAQAWLDATAKATDYRARKSRAGVQIIALREEYDGMDQRIRVAVSAAQAARRDQLLNEAATAPAVAEAPEVDALRARKTQLREDIEALDALVREQGQDGINWAAERGAETAFAAELHRQVWPKMKAALGAAAEVFELAMIFRAAGHPLTQLHPTNAGWHVEPFPAITNHNGPGWLKSLAERAAS